MVDNEEAKAVGKNLNNLRENKYPGMSLNEISNRSHVSRPVLQSYFDGKKVPGGSNLLKLARFFDTDVDQIIYGDNERMGIRIKFTNEIRNEIEEKYNLVEKGSVADDIMDNIEIALQNSQVYKRRFELTDDQKITIRRLIKAYLAIDQKE